MFYYYCRCWNCNEIDFLSGGERIMILNYTRFHPITCLLLDSGKRIETLSNFLQFSLGHRWTRTVHLSFRTWWSWRPPTRNSARKLPKSWKMCWKWVRFHYFQLGNLPNECNYRRLFFFPFSLAVRNGPNFRFVFRGWWWSRVGVRICEMEV